MGAWGLKTFENDDASDWLYDLEESNDLSVIEEALDIESGYLESPDGCNVLAAAEVILALLGKPRLGFPENAARWVNNHKSLDPTPLKRSAVNAITCVLSDESELKELWQESEEFDEWKKDVNETKIQLESS